MEELFVAILSMLLVLALIPLFVWKRRKDSSSTDTHEEGQDQVWGKTGSKVYGPRAGLDYKDNQLCFSLLCQAALEAPQVLNLNNSENFSGPYGEDVVFIANDWHTALLPCNLKTMYQSRGLYKNAKVAFCIHNIAYQGRFPFGDFALVNLPNEFKSSFDFIDGNLKPAKGRKINWMKAGIIESQRGLNWMMLTVKMMQRRLQGVLSTYEFS